MMSLFKLEKVLTMEIYEQLRCTKSFTFNCLVSKEGDLSTYISVIDFKTLCECFSVVPFDSESQLLLQRETHKSRVSNITNYIKDNEFCFPIFGAICEKILVDSPAGPLTQIKVPADSFRYLFDGQGRLSAIKKILESNPELSDNTVTVKFVQSSGVASDNQKFADWNSSSVKPNKSICHTMDSRQTINRFTKELISRVPQLKNRINYTAASVTASSSTQSLWTLNQMVSFVKLSLKITEKSAETVLDTPEKSEYWIRFFEKFFAELSSSNQYLKSALSGSCEANLVRKNTVIGTSVFLKSLAMTARVIAVHLQTTTTGKVDWSFMKGLSHINFEKRNPEWLGRCMNFRGKFEDKTFNHKAVSSMLLENLQVPVPDELMAIEEEVLLARASELKSKREEHQESSKMESIV